MKPANDWKGKVAQFFRDMGLTDETLQHGEVKLVYVNGGIARLEKIETIK